MPPQAFVFDAYGTLLDVHSVLQPAGAGLPPGLSILWRQKQLEYTWLRALMDRYQDFWHVTGDALRAAAAQMKMELSSTQFEALMQAYLRPAAYPDARVALESLQPAPRAILSNGSPEMLAAAVRHNGLDAHLAEIISVDRVKTYKPSPNVYALGPELLKLRAAEILFISSNAWDVAGAKAFGYRVCWCNRAGAPMEQLGQQPDLVVSKLDEIAEAIASIP